jgi:VWFA-related protein
MRLRALAIIGVGAAIGSAAAAQIRVDVALIETVATVTDARGRYVSKLTVNDFIVEEDGIPQTVAHVSESANQSMSVGILLDTSQSMQTRMPTATAAIERFIRAVHRDDDIFLMSFSSKSSILQDFTDDRNRLSAALRRIQLAPNTALYDGVDNALRHIRRGKHTKRAILLLTDGQDSGGRADAYREVLANLRHSDVMVYALGIEAAATTVSGVQRGGNQAGPIGGAQRGAPPQRGGQPRGGQQQPQQPGITIPVPGLPGGGVTIRRFAAQTRGGPVGTRGGPGGQRGPVGRGPQTPGPGTPNARGAQDGVNMSALNAFADASGGRAWLVRDGGGEMNRIMDDIAEELRNQYTVGYYPTHPISDGVLHRVEIRARNPALSVRARHEYFGR